MKRLVLIDGNSLLHRAYHALPKTLTAPDGTVVNAVYGFTRMLLKVVKDLKPDYLAVAFDAKGPTFRHIEYEGYKKKRPRADAELVRQFPIVKKLIHALGIPVYEVQGFEGEDIIATIVVQSKKQKAKSKNVEAVVVTGDRDVLQLVDEKTKVYAPVKGLSDPVLFDATKVKEKYGLTPEQIVDFKALRGDPSDDIPGVPGIGEKTARELLQRYGSLENIYRHLDEIKPRVKKLLEENRQQADLSRKLATITTNAPVELNLKARRKINPKNPAAIRELEKLNFRSLIKELNPQKESADDSNQMKLV